MSVNWASTWDEYARGNVVSTSARNLIQSFLLNTMASSGKAADDVESDADDTEDDEELPPLKLPSQKFCVLLQRAEDVADMPEENATKTSRTGERMTKAVQKRCRQHDYEQSHRIGEAVWKTDTLRGVEAGDRENPGNMFENTYQEPR